jgi:SpoVK/Ycf46/Vps4 family AAA+-type ATPase
MVKALFTVARTRQPAVVFVDEIDSMLSRRKENEHESSRRLKTEFLVQMDGAGTNSQDRVLIMGATNLPHELDDAVLRRLSKRVYVPLPDPEGRRAMLEHLFRCTKTSLNKKDWSSLVAKSDGYSCSDLADVAKEAAMGPVRDMTAAALVHATVGSLRPVSMRDFDSALRRTRPSVSPESLAQFSALEKEFG